MKNNFSFIAMQNHIQCTVKINLQKLIIVIAAKSDVEILDINLSLKIIFEIQFGKLTAVQIGGTQLNAIHEDLVQLKRILGGLVVYEKISNFYIVQEKINEGTFAQVYKIKCQLTQKIYAVKCMSKQRVDIQEIKEEVRIQRSLNHKNIAKVIEIYESIHNIYIILELLDQELSNDFDHNDIKLILYQLFKAIKYLHDNNIIHRDIKPCNIMLDEDNVLKIIDFGLAKDLNQTMMKMSLCGTPCHMAPEIFKSNYDNRCDIFSAGTVMYYLYTGKYIVKGRSVQELTEKNQYFDINKKKLPIILDYGTDLLAQLLHHDPKRRITLTEIFNHPYFLEVKNEQVEVHNASPQYNFIAKFKAQFSKDDTGTHKLNSTVADSQERYLSLTTMTLPRGLKKSF